MFKRNSFKLKLFLSYILIIVISFGLVGIFLSRALEQNAITEIKSSLVNQAALAVAQISPDKLRSDDTLYLMPLAKDISLKVKCRATIINNKGKVLAESTKEEKDLASIVSHFYRPEVQAALAGGIGTDTHRSSVVKVDMLYVAMPVKDKEEVVGVLRLALPLVNVQEMLLDTRKTIILGAFFSVLLALGASFILASGISKPINKIILASRQFSEGNLSHTIVVHSKDEIGELAATFNKMAQDVENKINETKLQNQHLKSLFNSMIEGVIVTDKAGRIISVNSTIENMFSILKKNAEGKVLLEAIPNNDIAEVMNKVLKTGEFVSGELSLIWPIKKILQVNASPIFENDSVGGCLVVVHDITEIRKLEMMRRDFVANVSHELKTPLTSIKGFVETLLEGAIEDKENSRQFLNIIQDHAERLNSLINDLLDLSYVESKEAKLNLAEFNFKDLLAQVVLGVKAQLKKKGIEFKDELPASTIKADKAKLEQVLINLIVNAIKFNKEKGFIRVYSEDLGDKIKIVVEDSGLGIPEKDISRIFERFYRVDKARSRELGGTGLGLSIVKHIVELHKGSVGVESIEAQGSKFWFIIPR